MIKHSLCMLLVLLAAVAGCRKEQQLDADLEMAEDKAAREREILAFRRIVERRLQALHGAMDALLAQTQDAGTHVEVADAVAGMRKQEDAIRARLQHLADADAMYRSQRRGIREALYNLESKLEATQLQLIAPREVFQQALRVRLDALDRELTALRDRAQNAARELPEEYDRQIARLRRQHEALARRHEALEAAAPAAFQKMRRAMIDALAAHTAAVHKVADSLDLVGG